MTPSTTDPDAGLEERVAEVLWLETEQEIRDSGAAYVPWADADEEDAETAIACRRAARRIHALYSDALVALRERAERAEERTQRAIQTANNANDTAAEALRQRDRLRAALEEARSLVKSAWCEGHNIGLGDGHPLAGPPHRWEDSDACADLAALSDSPAPEVRDGK